MARSKTWRNIATIDGTTDTRTHNSVNELTARTNPKTSLTYDDAGNSPYGETETPMATTSTVGTTENRSRRGGGRRRAKPVAPSRARARSHAERNRCIEVQEKQSGNWNTVAEYRYDGKNRRILKTVTNKGDLNATTRFLWGGKSDWQCLEERDGSGDLVARYTYATTYIDAVAVQERDLNSDGDFLDDDEVVYYHSNTLYSVYALSDADENVVERMRYEAYGAATVLDSDFSSDADGASDVENPYTFTGRRLDLESDLMQYRNRYYDPGLGRFVSRDPHPLAYTEGMSLYGYVSCGPVGHTDPLGFGIGDFFSGAWEGTKAAAGEAAHAAGAAARAVKNAAVGARKAVVSYLGAKDAQVSGGLTLPFFSDGGVWVGTGAVDCCDEDCDKWSGLFKKVCKGVAGGFELSVHALAGIKGKNCPGAYEGIFYEWSAGLEAGASGFTSGKVSGGGVYAGLVFPASVVVCNYSWLWGPFETPGGCK